MIVKPIKARVFKESKDLVQFIVEHIPTITNSSVLAVTSKIVALAEGRTAVVKNEKERERLIRSESQSAQKSKYVWLTMKDGLPMANAGIDDSNADGKLVLLPKDSFRAAATLRKQLQKVYKVKRLGVIVTDSRVMPMRAGVVGVALGYAGFSGIKDYRGKPDIFGRKMKFTQTDTADSLATAAVLVMGEGRESQPLCIIEDAPVVFTEKMDRRELVIAPKDDMYLPMFSRKGGRKKKR